MRLVMTMAAVMLALPAMGQSAEWAELDKCYGRHAATLDDLTSDALSIARVIRFQCFDAEMALAKNGGAHQALNEPLLMRSASVVLRVRAALKSDAAKKP